MRRKQTPGVYHLVLRLARPTVLRVGRLGRFAFPAGYYVYTGSAMNGLEQRMARHRRQRKKVHWHIDYLLRRAELIEVVPIATRRKTECARNGRILSLPGAELIAPRFGSSDCRCSTHLVYFRSRPVSGRRLGNGKRHGESVLGRIQQSPGEDGKLGRC